MKNFQKISSFILCMSFCSMFFQSQVALAAPSAIGQGFEISPPLIELKGKPGDTLTTVINLRNTTKLPISAHSNANDFTAKDASGDPGILVDGVDADGTGMRKWFLPIPDQVLPPGILTPFRVGIKIPADASPGGHYGVMRFTSASSGTNGGNGVSLSASVGTLFLLTVDGKVKHQVTMAGFHAERNGRQLTWFQNGKLDFSERLHNDGNVHEKIGGTLIITDMFHKKVAQLPVNTPPGNILPKTYREYKEHLDKKMLGFYTARLYLSYNGGNQVETRPLNFIVIPTNLIIIIVLVLIVLVIFFSRFQLTPRSSKRSKK